MSRAFVKETDPDAPVELPDRPISSLKNYMTSNGHAAMQRNVAALREELEQLGSAETFADRNRQAELKRDIRYFNTRLASAEIISPQLSTQVRFGNSVTFVDDDEQQYKFQIVGEDEASVSEGKISWASPLARSLIGATVGDVVHWVKDGETVDITITTLR